MYTRRLLRLSWRLSVCLSVCHAVYCAWTVRSTPKVSAGVKRKRIKLKTMDSVRLSLDAPFSISRKDIPIVVWGIVLNVHWLGNGTPYKNFASEIFHSTHCHLSKNVTVYSLDWTIAKGIREQTGGRSSYSGHHSRTVTYLLVAGWGHGSTLLTLAVYARFDELAGNIYNWH
jgi:hypothetical protein